MRELILKIKEEVISSEFSIGIENQIKEKFLSFDDIKDIYNAHASPPSAAVLTNVADFQERIQNRNFYKKITNFLQRNGEKEITALTIQSGHPIILGLPWEIFLEDTKHHRPLRPNTIIRRSINQITNDGKVNLGRKKLYMTCFSKLKSPLGANDITLDILKEIQELYSVFKPNMDIEANIRSGDLRNLSGEYSFVHYGGHGDENGLSGQDRLLNADDFKKVKTELLFLNTCESGSQHLNINSLCYNLISIGNSRYVIGMQHTIQSEYALDFAKNFYNELQKSKGDLLKSFSSALNETRFLPITTCHLIPVIYGG